MAKKVYKYPVSIADEFKLGLPAGARVLSVQMQGNEPFIWALVDPDRPAEARRFRLAGTGHPIEDAESLSFIGTFQLHGGMLIFHLFERI